MRRQTSGKKGFTLVEIMMATAILGIVILAAATAFQFISSSLSAISAAGESNQNLFILSEYITKRFNVRYQIDPDLSSDQTYTSFGIVTQSSDDSATIERLQIDNYCRATGVTSYDFTNVIARGNCIFSCPEGQAPTVRITWENALGPPTIKNYPSQQWNQSGTIGMLACMTKQEDSTTFHIYSYYLNRDKIAMLSREIQLLDKIIATEGAELIP